MAAHILAKRFYISGSVQGVGFRFFVERVAARLNISGYARNLLDGRVEVYAVGSASQLEALKAEIERGPRMARVNYLEESEAELFEQYLNGFSIESDA